MGGRAEQATFSGSGMDHSFLYTRSVNTKNKSVYIIIYILCKYGHIYIYSCSDMFYLNIGLLTEMYLVFDFILIFFSL